MADFPKDLTRDYTLSQMSLAAYDDNPKPPAGWGTAPIDSHVDPKTGFAAYAFQNPTTQEIVIAYRGTDDRRDITGPDAAMANPFASWDKQFTQGLDFAGKIMQEHPEAAGKISVTGHSLGGGLAEVTTKMYNLPGTTFDPAGASNITRSNEFAQYKRDHGITTNGPHPDFKGYVVRGSDVSTLTLGHVGPTLTISGLAGRDALEVAGEKLGGSLGLVGGIAGYGNGQANRHTMVRINGMFQKAVQENKPLPRWFAANDMPADVQANFEKLAQNGATDKLRAAGCSDKQCTNAMTALATRMVEKNHGDQIFFGIDPTKGLGIVSDRNSPGKNDVIVSIDKIRDVEPETSIASLSQTQAQTLSEQEHIKTRQGPTLS